MDTMNFAAIMAAAEPAINGNTTNLGLVLGVALVTWAGVWFYLLRIERLTRLLEREVETMKTESQK